MRSLNLTFWHTTPFLLFILFVTPVAIVLFSLTGSYNDNWSHLYNHVLFLYISNSIYLVIGVGIIVSIVGTSTAWLVTNYSFTGKKFFEWALILPLAVPPYILAYTFTGLFDTFGTANNLVRDIFNLGRDFTLFPKVRNVPGAIIVFSFTLYPYVYLVSRMAFINQSRSIIEAGRTLGLNKTQVFYKLGIPMIRPALIAGLMLVLMETLSDFGAVDHFAISTFTTGIFRTWFGLYDINTAMQLASCLLLFVIIFLVMERYSRRKATYSNSMSVFRPIKINKLKGLNNALAFLACFIPIFIGFVLPVLELTYWALNYKLDFFNYKFITTAWNTLSLAFLAAILTTALALLINFSTRYKKNKLLSYMSSFLTVGYAVPGLILAIGIMQFLTFIDKALTIEFFNLVLTGSLVGLMFAYVIKSYALSNSALESGYHRINSKIDDVSRTLKSSGWSMLTYIHTPLLKTSLLTSVLLVFSEVIKELPATLILRPFNFDTLATQTYEFAIEEMLVKSSIYSLVIILIGASMLIILKKIINKNNYVS